MSERVPKENHPIHPGETREVLYSLASTKAGRKVYKDIVKEWHALGMALGVSEEILDAIDKSGSSRDKALHDVIKSWLKEIDRPSWELLVKALSDPLLASIQGIQAVANDVDRQHCSTKSTSGL